MSNAGLATIGYEGSSIDDFLATLVKAGVTMLVDIREVAGSRRKGFSKGALSDAVGTVGIEYVHLRGLGDPKEGRDAARNGEIEKFKRIFSKHLESMYAQEDMQRAAEIASENFICLMCYERDPNTCHRKLVANRLASIIESDILHLGVHEGTAEKVFGKATLNGSGLGEGLTAPH